MKLNIALSCVSLMLFMTFISLRMPVENNATMPATRSAMILPSLLLDDDERRPEKKNGSVPLNIK